MRQIHYIIYIYIVYMDTYTYKDIYIHTYIHSHTHVHTFTHTHTYIHTCRTKSFIGEKKKNQQASKQTNKTKQRKKKKKNYGLLTLHILCRSFIKANNSSGKSFGCGDVKRKRISGWAVDTLTRNRTPIQTWKRERRQTG